MEKLIVDNAMYEVNELMKEKKFKGCEIEYVLINSQNKREINGIISDKSLNIYQVTTKDKEIMPAEDWYYNIDADIFKLLEENYEIGFMSLRFHSAIWKEVDRVGIEDIDYKIGLQKYLKYCKNNAVDKNTMDKEFDDDLPDIMKYYEEKTDYIEIRHGQVEMSVEMYRKENEIPYLAFCLGYDLLNEKLRRLENRECDMVYEFCDYLARKFMATDSYKNKWNLSYDNLKEWFEDNKDMIQSEYLQYFKVEDKQISEPEQKTKKNKERER